MASPTAASADVRAALWAHIQELRRKLLDLSRRNRLLNFQFSARRSLRFVEGDMDQAFARLNGPREAAKIDVCALPNPSRGDWVRSDNRLERPDPEIWARQQGISVDFELPPETRKELRALLYADAVASRCRFLQREADLTIGETGANPLHLILGFLQYPENPGSDAKDLAPLLAFPVRLVPRTVRGEIAYSLEPAGDEATDNLSLCEKLQVDYGLVLPPLPDPSEGKGAETYLAAIAEIIGQRPGFALRHEAALCLLGFGNLLLYRDLDPNYWPGLVDNRLIQLLLGDVSPREGNNLGASSDHPIEEEPARSIPLVCDADSSQHSALVDVLCESKDLVIEGPPGTGKSQTIANLIAACIAGGKSVLFVAEKRVALQVVAERLERVGLGPFLLELHSDRANRQDVLRSLDQRLRSEPAVNPLLPVQLERAERRRKQLSGYTARMNSTLFNRLGMTLHQIFWHSELHRARLQGGEESLHAFQLEHPEDLTDAALRPVEECLNDLGSDFEQRGRYGPDRPFWGLALNQLVPGDERDVTNALVAARAWAANFEAAAAAYCELRGEAAGLDESSARRCATVVTALLRRLDPALPLHLMESLMVAGPEGEGALAALAVEIEVARGLQTVMSHGLRQGAVPEPKRAFTLRDLDRAAAAWGASLGTAEEIAAWLASLNELDENLSQTEKVFQASAAAPDWQPIFGPDGLAKIARLAGLAEQLPGPCLDLQSPDLFHPVCVPALELAIELEPDTFLDQLPPVADLEAATVTLRRRQGWLRWLHADYRSAVRLAGSLLRRHHFPVAERAELVAKLARLAWFSTTWPVLANVLPAERHRYLALAQWNRAVSAMLREIGLPSSFQEPESVIRFVTTVVAIGRAAAAVSTALEKLKAVLPLLDPARPLSETVARVADLRQAAAEPSCWLQDWAAPCASLGTVVAACEAANRLGSLVAQLVPLPFLGTDFQGLNTDVAAIHQVLALVRELQAGELEPVLQANICREPLLVSRRLADHLSSIVAGFEGVTALQEALQPFGTLDPARWAGAAPEADLLAFAQGFRERLEWASSRSTELYVWFQRERDQAKAARLGVARLVEVLEANKVPAALWCDAYRYLALRSIGRNALRQSPRLDDLAGLRHSNAAEEFRLSDRDAIRFRGASIAALANQQCDPPPGQSGARVDTLTEMCLIRHLINQRRPRVPLRALLARAGVALRALKPCLMMSPQSVAQYLGPHQSFDIVVMDEASQITTETAIGAIGRGRQLVVVGDSKQLPPTPYFRRMAVDSDDEPQYTAIEAESILEVCSARLNSRRLRWHYRSQHESLIAFSNHHFYDGDLIVFPSPFAQGGRLGVRAVYLADAVYLDQRNQREARRVVDLVLEHILQRPDDSLGVVTLNRPQCDLIDDLLQERLRQSPEAEEWSRRQQERGQPLFVRNLENVQGDERDAIIISTTFGKPPGANRLRQNFGPISRGDGWRRLNVLFTRARISLTLVTSMRPEDITVDETTPAGARTLREYIEYARTGRLDLPRETGREPESPFESVILALLRQHGYDVTPQLGVSGYRVDIAVRHPDVPGAYLAAVECDGASYHAARSVRDRDRIRQEIIESVGWRGRIWRIWSTDWFRNPTEEAQRLLTFLDHLRQTWRPEPITGERWYEENVPPGLIPVAGGEITTDAEPISPDEIEIQIGDTVRYVNLSQPDEVHTVQISAGSADPGNGIIAAGAPLAQVLLGAMAGIEVTLRIPGSPPKQLRVVKVSRTVLAS